ncbi:hypothetical protein PWT90_08213 [Aphanocladium album]|nr:hypothetical protein PWT90_08213 [Aphanocladium album]
MKSVPLASLIALAGAASIPPPDSSYPTQTAHLTFRDANNQTLYHLAVFANDTKIPTNSNSAVAYIDAPDYAASSLCHFEYAFSPCGGTVPEISNTGGPSVHSQQVVLTPATAIKSIRCKGHCVEIGEKAEFVSQICCNGVVLDGKCKPWDV